MPETLYFAYGSNIDLEQMARRCPAAQVVGPATLENYELAFRGSGFATIMPKEGSVVHGLLWSITPLCEQALDRYEGYPRHYTPQAVARIQSLRPKIFIAGHSHILKVIYDPVYDLLHLNPGAAGCYGFHKVRSALRFTIDGTDIRDMEIGEWPRPGA